MPGDIAHPEKTPADAVIVEDIGGNVIERGSSTSGGDFLSNTKTLEEASNYGSLQMEGMRVIDLAISTRRAF